MKMIKKSKLPKCDFCKTNDASYDAPTGMGSWANMCKNCYPACKGANAELVGHKFEQRDVAAPVPNSKTLIGIEPNSDDYWENVLFDDLREIECPSCGESHSVEPDAAYKYNCEGCGVRVQVPIGLF